MKELIAIQTELKAPKNAYNAFGKYKYRTTESILEGLKPLLEKYKCYINMTDSVYQVGDRHYVVASASITNEAGTTILSNGYAREENEKKGMDGAQITGAASSYARKYALSGLFAIDDTKDPDDTNKGEDKKDDNKDNGKIDEGKKTLSNKIKELPWLNPSTENWTYSVGRIKAGVKVEEVEKHFRISAENKKALLEQANAN